MTRLCGNCSRPCKKYGEPRRLGAFVDQIVTCPKCGWCGVETEITDEVESPVQLDMFTELYDAGMSGQRGASRSHERGDARYAEPYDGVTDRADGIGLES